MGKSTMDERLLASIVAIQWWWICTTGWEVSWWSPHRVDFSYSLAPCLALYFAHPTSQAYLGFKWAWVVES